MDTAKSPLICDEPLPFMDRIRRLVTHDQAKGVAGCFDSYRLHSAFQPIYSLAHKRAVGYEALIRATDQLGRRTQPAMLFEQDFDNEKHVLLDRLCRYIHLGNFVRLNDNLNWLFLNISPKVISSGLRFGSFFKSLLDEFSFPSHRIVIEIVENPIEEENQILEATSFYRNLGCLIAIDDFGTGHSNFERVWMLRPHIVKLDRSMVVRAAGQRQIRHLLPGIISLLHQAGALVLIEGIETEDQALIAMESDADFVQGYYFAKPAEDLHSLGKPFNGFDDLFGCFKSMAILQQDEVDSIYDGYKAPFNEAIRRIREGQPLPLACEILMRDPSVVRCYLLQPDGIQIGYTVSSENSSLAIDRRFDPLADAKSADWFRRHYLRRAIMHPKQLQITRPYLSITGSHMCVTLSMMYPTDSGRVVLCCDLNGAP